MTYSPTFSTLLCQRMEQVGHTRKSLAYAIGKSGPGVGKWMRGVGLPAKSCRQLLAKALNVSTDELDALIDGGPLSETSTTAPAA